MNQSAPQAAPTDQSTRALSLFGIVALLSTALDLWSKSWAEQLLAPLPRNTMAVFDPWLELSLACNQGTAFGVVTDLGVLRFVFGGLALLVVGALFWMVWQHRHDLWQAGAFGLLAGGALGNAIDRVFRTDGAGGTCVIDFVKVNYPWGGSWPTFNLADAWLVVGVGMIILRMIQAHRSASKTQS